MNMPIRNEHLPRTGGTGAPHHIYRALLLAYPHAFRSEFGDEMTQVFIAAYRDVVRQGGAGMLLLFWCVMLMDLVVTATAERLKEGFSMSRSNLVRLGGIALLIGGVLQGALLATQVAITLDYAIAYTAPKGSPWIGRGEVALSLAPLLALLLLLGLLGLHALVHTRTGAVGLVAITLIAVGLVTQAAAGTLASALSWGDLSACISARNCNIYDGAGMLRQAIAVVNTGYLIGTPGLLLYGIVMLRARPLPRGNSLPLLLVVAGTLPYLIMRIALTLVPSPDAEGSIRLDSVLMAGSLAVAVVSFLLGSAILRAASQLPPATAAPASAGAAPA